MTKSNSDGILIRAKILAYNQRFETVADLYKKHGYEHEAMQLFTDLRMFDDAQVKFPYSFLKQYPAVIVRLMGIDWMERRGEGLLSSELSRNICIRLVLKLFSLLLL